MPTLDWIGKKAVLNHHREVPFRLLKCDKSLSFGEADSGNLLVQGDNLLALKALLPYYARKVKCIYIDPPYNTGNENWVYNDAVNSPEMKNWLGKTVGAEAEDLTRHDKWLCMMYPRLSLLREFLSHDGAIFISIDDNEVTGLRSLLDELFGVRNFVASVVWQKVYSPRMDAKGFSNDHDYVVIYQRSDAFKVKKVAFQQNEAQFTTIDKKTGLPYRKRSLRKEGKNARRIDRPNLFYSITAPDGTEIFPIRPDGSEGNWRWGRDSYSKNKNMLEWVRNDKGWQVYVKQFLNPTAERPPSSIWLHSDAGHNHEAIEEIKTIFSATNFPTPKPTRLIQRILEVSTNDGDIILDSFAGSGSVGHSVLDINKKKDGNRKFILIEMDENICQNVTAQRLRKVIEGYPIEKNSNKIEIEGLGGGFRFCKLGEPLFDEAGNIQGSVNFSDLAAHIYFTETGSPLPKRAKAESSLLGVHEGRAVYLLYNGVLGDKKPEGGNVLTGDVLESLPSHAGPKVVYGEACRLGGSRLQAGQITFKQIPYQIKVN